MIVFLIIFFIKNVFGAEELLIELTINGNLTILKQERTEIYYNKGTKIKMDCVKPRGLSNTGSEVPDPELTINKIRDSIKQSIAMTRGFNFGESPLKYTIDENFDETILQCVFQIDGKKEIKEIKFLLHEHEKLQKNGLFMYILIGLGSFMAASLLIILIIFIYSTRKNNKRNSLIDNNHDYAEPVVIGIVNSSMSNSGTKSTYTKMFGV